MARFAGGAVREGKVLMMPSTDGDFQTVLLTPEVDGDGELMAVVRKNKKDNVSVKPQN